MRRKFFIGLFFAAVLSVITAAAMSEDYNQTVVVTIKGNNVNFEYNGQRHSAVGYTVETNSRYYSADDFVCYAIDSVSAVKAGTYNMGISSNDFCNVNPKYKNVVFEVIDGSLTIINNRIILLADN